MRINVKPSDRQIAGCSFLLSRPDPNPGGFLCHATGSGKSVIQILTAFRQHSKGLVEKTIIFCTKSSLIEVLNDFETRTDVRAYVIRDLANLEHFYRTAELSFGLVQYNVFCNMVTARAPRSPNNDSEEEESVKVKTPIIPEKFMFLWNLITSRKTLVSLDEAHTIKSPDSFIGRVFRKMRPAFSYCYGATATAVMADIMDLYHIADFFKPNHFGSIAEFQENFLVMRTKKIYTGGGRSITVKELISYKNLPALQLKVAEVCHSSFPPYDIHFIKKEGPMEDQAIYQKAAQGVFMKGSGETDWHEKKHAARLIDLQYVVNKDPGKKKLLLEALKGMIDKGVLIFCSYYESVGDVEKILKEHKIEFKEISGRIEDRKVVKDWFVSSPKGKALIITRAGGQSLNLQACYSADTEVLTEDGWLNYPEIKSHTKIAQWDKSGINFTPAGSLLEYDYEGPMHSFRNESQDILVTPNHRMLAGAPKLGSEMKVMRADSIVSGKRFLTSSAYTPNESSTSSFIVGKSYVHKTKLAPLVALYLTCSHTGNGIVGIPYQEDLRHRRYFDEELKGMNELRSPEGLGRTYVLSKELSTWLRLEFGKEKVLPWNYQDEDTGFIIRMAQWFKKEVGSSYRREDTLLLRKRVTADTLQAIYMRMGYTTVLWADKHCFYLTMKPGESVVVKTKEMETVQYKGKVFCYSIPSGMMVTRRNGKVAIQGNTPNMIFFDIPFGIGYMLQVMGRVCREYSDHKKFEILFIILQGTIDEYKYQLISSNREVLMRLFKNELVPPSEQMTSFNQDIMDALKSSLLWKK